MSFCRICRTQNNLKYTLKELRRINKKLGNNSKDLIYAVPATQTGNICYDCEERLHNFNKHINGDSDVDVECSSAIVREDSPVIVDDDELLYNLFFQKQNCLGKTTQEGAKVEQRPYTQHSLGSDGDTEIIEVLTSSRESTPFHDEVINNVSKRYAAPKSLANAIPIVVIDLEEDEKAVEGADEEEIVFQHVSTENEPAKICSEPKTVQRKLKRLSENETKLIASLSLISSDSEDEETQPLKNLALKATSLPQTHDCSICHLKFNDLLSVKSHQESHNPASCPVCNANFALSQRLVKHMRTKHRSYSGDMLKERQKCAQDSAMTIRLRYQQRYTFYECQLCGKIDGVFKEHKEHIMTQHASESKSLNDPMMKELKCPLCKATCGAQYMSLCEHLRVRHRDKHSPHLKEMPHTHPFGWSAERQRDIEKTARVFQFLSRKGRYFECMTCNNIAPGYFNHWKHLSSRSCNALSYKNEQRSDTKHKSPQVKQKLDTSSKNRVNGMAAKQVDTKKQQTNVVNTKKEKEQRKDKKKPPATASKNGNVRTEISKKTSKKAFKVPALVKVKIKPRLLAFSTQEFICKYCKVTFKGFYALNVHQLKQHSDDEYYTCKKCCKLFIKSNVMQESTDCPQCASLSQLNELEQTKNPPCKHHRRKCRIATTVRNGSKPLKSITEKDNKAQGVAATQAINKSSLVQRDNISVQNSCVNFDWLPDLMQFALEATKTHHCEYCARLFAEESYLITHLKKHVERKEAKVLKRIPHKRVVR